MWLTFTPRLVPGIFVGWRKPGSSQRVCYLAPRGCAILRDISTRWYVRYARTKVMMPSYRSPDYDLRLCAATNDDTYTKKYRLNTQEAH